MFAILIFCGDKVVSKCPWIIFYFKKKKKNYIEMLKSSACYKMSTPPSKRLSLPLRKHKFGHPYFCNF